MTLLAMYDMDEEEQSPTDTSEDSIEVRIKPIKSLNTNINMTPGAKKNKRKSMEPKRLSSAVDGGEKVLQPLIGEKRCRLNSTGSEDRSPPVSYNSDSRSPSPSTSPTSKRMAGSPICLAPKKRFKFDALRDLEESSFEKKISQEPKNNPSSPVSPFRPWSEGAVEDTKPYIPAPPSSNGTTPGVPYIPFLLPGASLPLSLPLDPRLYPYHLLQSPYLPTSSQLAPQKASAETNLHRSPPTSPVNPSSPAYSAPVQEEPLSLVIKDRKKDRSSPVKVKEECQSSSPPKKNSQTVPSGPFNVEALISAQKKHVIDAGPCLSSNLDQISPVKQALPTTPPAQRVRNDSGSTSSSGGDERAKQRNYKNMTRERRVEANARERQRVHTITAAFDNLQAAIPNEEENVKLSKLSVIKIATAYIMALSRMAGHDYTEDQSAPPVEEVIQHCSEVIETESRIKKRNNN